MALAWQSYRAVGLAAAVSVAAWSAGRCGVLPLVVGPY